nr:unnamed protein product [Callosobruchus chinensis]
MFLKVLSKDIQNQSKAPKTLSCCREAGKLFFLRH